MTSLYWDGPLVFSLLSAWPLPCRIYFRTYKNMFGFSIISKHWESTGSWNPSSWKTRAYLYYTTIIMTDMMTWWHKEPGPRFNIKMTSYQYRKSHCGDKTILRPSYLHNGISYTGKTASLYWIGALDISSYGIDLVLVGPILITWFNISPIMDK